MPPRPAAGALERVDGAGGDDDDVARVHRDLLAVDRERRSALLDDERLGVRVAVRPRPGTLLVPGHEERDRRVVVRALELHRAAAEREVAHRDHPCHARIMTRRAPAPPQYDRGIPSTCCPRKASTRLFDTGATE